MTTAERFQAAFLILLVLAISILFMGMIRRMLLTLLMAGIFAGLAYPLYRRILGWVKGRRMLAAAGTLLLCFLLVFIPFTLFLGIVTAQAIRVSETVVPWVQNVLSSPATISGWLDELPFREQIEPYREEILTRAGSLVAGLGNFVFRSLSSTTGWTAGFLLQLFIMLYAMFYFLIDGRKLLNRIFYYLPLAQEDEERISHKFVSVTRASLKSTLVIGAVQGAMAGIGFAVAGVGQSIFWGTVMAVLSIIPGVGTAVVWLPAVIYLVLTEKLVAGIALGIYCAAIVGTVDNVLRPRLVGHDTQMHDLLILLSTLGGLFMFGVMGIIVGPIIGALFVAVWDLYGATFRNMLPAGASDPD